MLNDIRWVKRYHPDVKVVSMHHTLHRNVFEEAGAQTFVSYGNLMDRNYQPIVDEIRNYVEYSQ